MLTLDAQSYCWWLAGYVEANGGPAPTPYEWQVIVARLETLSRAQRAGAASTVPINTGPWVRQQPLSSIISPEVLRDHVLITSSGC